MANDITSLNIMQRQNFLDYAKRCAMNMTDVSMFRSYLQFRDRAYALQLDQSAKRVHELNRYLGGSERRMVDRIDVPIIMPQIESAVAYQTSVYLLKHPIFPVVSGPKFQGEAFQFQSVMEQHSIRYGWVRELIKTFRNGFKYNFAPTFVNWRRVNGKTVGTALQGANVGLGQIQQQTIAGNEIKSLNPYNCFFDMLVDPAKYHEEGSFFGWTEIHNRMQFKRFCDSLDPTKTTQFREAFESAYNALGADPTNMMGYYIPTVNPIFNPSQARLNRGTNWLEYVGLVDKANSQRINYKDKYLVTHFICRALPSDFGKQGQQPTIYYGIIVNWKVVIYVQEIISPNDYLPVVILTPNEDGLGYQTQSMLDAALPFQDMASALWNTTLESKRRLVFDRLLYNSRVINKDDIDPASAVARIPVRNVSQLPGNDISKAVFQIPYRDDNTAMNLQMAEQVSFMADQAVGQNKVDRGQFQRGNKTKTEFDTVMGNSNSRQQLTSLQIEGQFMTPVKTTLRDNILLYQSPEQMVSPVDNKTEVNIDPAALRQAQMNFQLTDGKMSIEDIMSPDLLMVFMQTAQSMPVLMSEYDIMGMFMYWMQLKGATWLEEFKRNPQQQQQFLIKLKQTSAAQAAVPPEQNPAMNAGGPMI